MAHLSNPWAQASTIRSTIKAKEHADILVSCNHPLPPFRVNVKLTKGSVLRRGRFLRERAFNFTLIGNWGEGKGKKQELYDYFRMVEIIRLCYTSNKFKSANF